MSLLRAAVFVVLAVLLGGCAGPKPASPPATPAELQLVEAFPHVRLDAATRTVEFDARLSPMLAPDPKAPLFFLEVVACTPDTREHETLIVTLARPSHVHAALLAAGFAPGEPGGWKLIDNRLEPIDATGDRLDIRFVYDDTKSGREIAVNPLDWIVSIHPAHSLARPGDGWRFAGSRLIPAPRARTAPAPPQPAEVYDADGSGTLIGLTTFGSETIAWSRTISPDAGAQEPEWIARMDALPPAGTPIRVRLRPPSP